MDWIERLNSAVNYIEENIGDNIDLNKVARIACCSVYHFQRMFAYMANIPLSEYIRRRRMSLAAVERRIVTEWLPNSGYEYSNAPDIEVYLNADPNNVKYEVWIPVVKKES